VGAPLTGKREMGSPGTGSSILQNGKFPQINLDSRYNPFSKVCRNKHTHPKIHMAIKRAKLGRTMMKNKVGGLELPGSRFTAMQGTTHSLTNRSIGDLERMFHGDFKNISK
jgi:hypothetical protein